MVIPARIEGATRVLAKDLPIRDVEINGISAMVSAWELTPKEIEAISSGAKIYITVMGKNHPPIAVNVGVSYD